MAQLFEGTCFGKAVNVEVGRDPQRKKVRWEMEVTRGEHKGKRANYSGKLDPENIRFTKAAMKALGWKGETIKTFVDDVKAANLEIEFQAEIASHEGRQWTSARITGALPLKPLDEAEAAEVDDWFREADAAEQPLPF